MNPIDGLKIAVGIIGFFVLFLLVILGYIAFYRFLLRVVPRDWVKTRRFLKEGLRFFIGMTKKV